MKVSSLTRTRKPKALDRFFSGWFKARQSREIAEWTIGLLDLQPRDRVLEIGSRSAITVQLAARRCPLGLIAGIEPDASLVRRARRRYKVDIMQGRLVINAGTVSALPYPDRSFDKVFSINSLQSSTHLLRDLKELHRVLRPDGLLLVVRQVWNGRYKRSKLNGREEVEERLPQQIAMAGFDVVHKEVRLMRPMSAYGVIARKISVESQRRAPVSHGKTFLPWPAVAEETHER